MTFNGFRTLALASLILGAVAASGPAETDLTEAQMQAVLAAQQRRIDTIERVYPTVVAIYGQNPAAGGGSGVVFHRRGFVMTNFHVVRGAGGKTGWAGLADGKLYRWKLVGMDPGGDLAIIQLMGKDRFAYATFGDSNAVRVGDWAMAMGNPFALADNHQPTVTLGIVSGTHRYQGGAGGNFLVYGNCIQIDSSINPGNSGGPLFNLDGRVIGINGRGSFEERGRVNVGLGYAISAEQIRYFIPEMLSTKTTLHATLDATFIDRADGVVCNAIDYDLCPLADKGLDLGDKLLRFNGKPIRAANEFLNELTMLPAGWPVAVEWLHEGERRSATVRLNELPYKTPKPNRPRRAEEEKPDDIKLPNAEQMRPGVITNPKLNRTIAEMIVTDWLTNIGGKDHDGARKAFGELPVFTLDSLADAKAITLHGSGRADGQVAAKIELQVDDETTQFMWLSLFDMFDEPRVRLIKTAPVDDDDATATIYRRYDTAAGPDWPLSRVTVTGLTEEVAE